MAWMPIRESDLNTLYFSMTTLTTVDSYDHACHIQMKDFIAFLNFYNVWIESNYMGPFEFQFIQFTFAHVHIR